MEVNEITGQIVDTAFKIHVDLGPGLLESVYELAMARTLSSRGFHVSRQHAISFSYEGHYYKNGFRLDLLVESRVIVEIKSVETLAPIHHKQALTYLRLSEKPIGLLINFGAARLKEGLRRIVNDFHSRDTGSF